MNSDTRLDESQIAFINEMKAKGHRGCSLTVNNQQTYVDFYTNKIYEDPKSI